MHSTNASNVFQTDASRGAGLVNLKDISEADARRIMSEEHRALGYRPPPGSLASQAQAVIARHESRRADEHALTLDEEQIRQAALADAERIKQQKEGSAEGSAEVDLDAIGEAEARKLMSDEHKALGYRPPPDSLASEAQSAAVKHPDASAGVDTTLLAKAALEDAIRVASGNGGSHDLDLSRVGEAEARRLMSEEHRALGYRPPPGSLASTAQSEAAKHPYASADLDPAALAQAALEDAKKISAERACNLTNIGEARKLMSEEHKTLGYRPPAGSLAATAQSAASKHPDASAGIDPETLADVAHQDAHRIPAERSDEPSSAVKETAVVNAEVPVTKRMASSLVSEAHKARGHLPESGTIASTAQSLADKNARDGGERSLADAGAV
ncbi:hypothetical protein BN946_scf184999.g76 [Trametes cinnabarina]|uniref:SMP domain-containing protein n=1 Tax=Pycnoporus cinnabarinus TaxID=5643 RepID=A0A060S7U5_PYCCI|nr:hypothetical protein BN946_scf184999.g76 [Trametes cinnabarina]